MFLGKKVNSEFENMSNHFGFQPYSLFDLFRWRL